MSAIEWTEKTWNPVTGCTKVSAGCDNCYAEAIARRFAGGKAFPNGFDVTLHPERLDAPQRWRKPSRVFVNSMSDLFHADVPDEFTARVFASMALAPQHTFQVLTKRHGPMRALVNSAEFEESVRLKVHHHDETYRRELANWPLPHLWLGVSAEDQATAELRIPALLETRAAVRFVSVEPMLSPVRIRPEWAALDWIIVGGESGPGARPLELSWIGDLLADCRAFGIAPFVKQLGSRYGAQKGGDMTTWPTNLQVREYPAVAR